MDTSSSAERGRVLARTADGVCAIILDLPGAGNALTTAMAERLTGILRDATDNPDVRVVRVVGAGSDFCTGAYVPRNLRESAYLAMSDRSARAYVAMFDAWATCPVPVVAGVRGNCLGAGVAIAAFATVVVAEDGSQFGLPEIDLGLFPAGIVGALSGRLGTRAALAWGLTGQRYDANAATQAGLVDLRVPPDQMESAIERIADRIAGLDTSSASAVRAMTSYLGEESRVGPRHQFGHQLLAKSWTTSNPVEVETT